MSMPMTKWPRNKLIGTVVLYVATAAATQAYAQGDPPRAFDPSAAAVRAPGTAVRIDLIGDSTQTNNAGYGRGFCANLTPQIDCVNMAKGGASTKTFREQGLWERSLQTKPDRSEEHTSELQSLRHLVCRLLLEKKNDKISGHYTNTRST